MSLTPDEVAAIETNLFSVARPIVRERPGFPWHRDRSGKLTAGRHVSSQAFAVDFFETIKRLPSRDAIVDAWVRHLQLAFPGGPWNIELERTVSTHLLAEPRPTQIDALGTARYGLIAFEGKFTEQDGGACSQPRPLRKGSNAVKQCNGNYEHQINPVNQVNSRCALSGKQIRYWDLVPEVMNLDAKLDYSPCPFNGPWFQWMRNLVAARALGRSLGKQAAFVVVYADGPFAMATKVKQPAWQRLEQAVAGRSVPLRAVSHQALLAIAVASASPGDRHILDELSRWMTAKIDVANFNVAGLDDDSWPFLLQLRTHNILTATDWARILGWLSDALAFLGESDDTTTIAAGEVTIDLDADPRDAEWIGITRVYELTGHRIPGWAALWLLWLAHDRGATFWSAVGSAAKNAKYEKVVSEA
jgi:hypothetical protein